MSDGPNTGVMGPPPFDWSLGEYERTAAALAPAAAHAVRRAGLTGRETVLDLGCGTGNASLLAARTGATVTGLDGASRLLAVARDRVAAEGLTASFVEGDFHSLDFADESFDVVLSVFGVIFGDPSRVLPEILRVLRPGGRAVLTAWLPEGPIHSYIGGIVGLFAEAMGMPFPPPFPWSEPAALRPFLEPAGWRVTSEDGSVAFVGESPEAFLAEQEAYAPPAVSTRGLVEHFGLAPRIREQSLAILRAGNEDPAAFRVTSPYRVLELSSS
ncbi:MAG TPA: class I SAM-dependent methyltransferase [Actinomycetota bacterium]|nr:class I SAM-dependent methyltransferase [Actinomycetota bacterium]